MNQSLAALVNRIYPLEESVMKEMLALFEPVELDKKGFLLKEGQLTEDLFFIEAGTFRSYVMKDVDEITSNFFFAPTFYGDVVAIKDKEPTIIYLQALEDARVLKANIRQVEQLGYKHASLLVFFIRFYENVHAFNQKRQLSFIYDSAEERYLRLFNERPKVVSEIPLNYIASYLGIQPESLSRIRKKLAAAGSVKK